MRTGKIGGIWLVVTVTTVGGVVMAVELLGARMLSVAYGSSLTVWAAMISVTLLSLALGYFAGGSLADRFPRPRLLYSCLLAASALVALCPHMRFVLKACYSAMGLRAGALASSAIVFFLPLGLLGMTSPFVIRLLCSGERRVGVTSGGVYAISTIGSVAGTLLTGLWLIPAAGTASGFRAVAVLIAVVAAAGLVADSGAGGAASILVALAVGLVPGPASVVGQKYTTPDGERGEVVAVRDSAHGRIVVLRQGEYRLLVVNGIVQTGIPDNVGQLRKGDGLKVCYFQELLPYMIERPESARGLIIGLAGGMTAALLRCHGMTLDCVDIDPEIIAVARSFFSFSGPAVAADGRRFLEDCRERYDVCVSDTYSGDVFPFHLASVEAFRAAKRVLNPGGVLALNYIGAPRGEAFACLHRTLSAVFGHVLAVKGEPGNDVQTITIFAADRPLDFKNRLLDELGAFTDVPARIAAISRLTIVPPDKDAIVLTDDYNPIDFMRAGEALRWRERTARRIGREFMF